MIWRRGALGDPGSLDPHKATTLIESNVLGELFEGLLSRDARGSLVPGVAESWSVDAEGRVYVFKLRPDARWSNGDPVTADDFVFAFRRLMAPATGAPYADILYTLKNAEKVNKGELPPQALGARALSDGRLELTLEQPTPYFLEQLAHFTAKPLHRKSVEAFGGDFVHPAASRDERRLHAEEVHPERLPRAGQKPELLRRGQSRARSGGIHPARRSLGRAAPLHGGRDRFLR